MNTFFKNPGKFLLGGLFVLIFVFGYYHFSVNKQLLYKTNSACAKDALSFAKSREGVVTWQVLQSKFDEDRSACFAEFDSGGGITLIYDLTHSKELALYPADAGQLYQNVSGGEMSEKRIKYIKKYEEVRNDTF